MEKLPWILTTVLAIVMAIAIARNAKTKRKALEAELEQMRKTFVQQAEVIKQYNAIQGKASEIQREAKQREEELATAIKGVQTSEEPVKKSIDVGNGIVAGFNAE
ncbi:MAG: hypothetical protein IJG69_08475 [Spirochaetales bacterium]|nr:hypothetical protein [Spirochaetales bacterium]